ncbi:MAG: KEOPS complex subunit Pcc1 [Candidatus Hadarchaeales archaeon]
MQISAEVICVYPSKKVATAVAKAISPDNLKAPKRMKISTRVSGEKVMTEVKFDGRMETLIATLDDLLACIQTAESVL